MAVAPGGGSECPTSKQTSNVIYCCRMAPVALRPPCPSVTSFDGAYYNETGIIILKYIFAGTSEWQFLMRYACRWCLSMLSTYIRRQERSRGPAVDSEQVFPAGHWVLCPLVIERLTFA